MKKIFAAMLLFVAAISASAQFEQGTKYVGAYLSGLDLSYSSQNKFRLGIGAEAGYMVADHIMARADASWQHKHKSDEFGIGAGGRYYVSHHGFYLGAGVRYQHNENFKNRNMAAVVQNPTTGEYTAQIVKVPERKKYDNLMIPIEAGYSFYFNDYISIEPAVYYRMSLNHFSDGSEVGVKVGVGFYF